MYSGHMVNTNDKEYAELEAVVGTYDKNAMNWNQRGSKTEGLLLNWTALKLRTFLSLLVVKKVL